MDYSVMTDEKLIELSRDGKDEVIDYLLDKYKGLVRRKARTMFLVGGDTDDLIQEGMIGLYKAVRDYDVRKEASFLTFANLCIDRQIYSAINASNRKKHSPLNSYISFPLLNFLNDNVTNELYMDKQNVNHRNPEDLYIDRENVLHIEHMLEKELSAFEYEVLKMYIDGADYIEIAERMDKKPKSIDNAIQRIKKKVKFIKSF
ncbi:RNA polymerase sporulation sigma factor SigH [Bovifimicola ammoniilytica]|uniref:RNA polymerase sporulation sigma factor SigH n=1 Tax=Bovifimicola ammoniilytica TaxID=2981720 RepID=UPI000341539E|nr:RNA polymerase sporulation sigma factor SigH [Bovifimicola ammoniilytica]MCU6752463.1 RNA polymerase sporulation sigma factor SigH [Bovifimicola ammoniilytica]CCZ04143.1 rNA polymerase sigma 30 subunit SigH [Eubacterium sp. CAG:603]SCJ25667.1 Stage 0 sporulation protein H [uncultured Eubacterium sp.]HAX33417.1 RNA polymerase sporulation sigma factor SigH [Coprococcus sp.]